MDTTGQYKGNQKQKHTLQYPVIPESTADKGPYIRYGPDHGSYQWHKYQHIPDIVLFPVTARHGNP